MPLMICPKCSKFHYVPGECPQPKVPTASPAIASVPSKDAAPQPVADLPKAGKKSTAARKDVPPAPGRSAVEQSGVGQAPIAGTQAPPVDTKRKDTRKGDRHKPGYQAEKQAEYRKRRAAAKEGK